jgi:hypothetical protein
VQAGMTVGRFSAHADSREWPALDQHSRLSDWKTPATCTRLFVHGDATAARMWLPACVWLWLPPQHARHLENYRAGVEYGLCLQQSYRIFIASLPKTLGLNDHLLLRLSVVHGVIELPHSRSVLVPNAAMAHRRSRGMHSRESGAPRERREGGWGEYI